MDKLWYERITLVAVIITIIPGIFNMLCISVFGGKSLIENKKDSRTSSTITSSNINTKDKTEKLTEEFTFSNNNSSKDNLQSKSSTDIEELITEKDTYVQVISDTLNVRDEPNSDSDVITMVEMDDIFLVIKTIKIDENIWYEIYIDEWMSGYITSDFVKIITE